jgi:sulfur carrier protein
MISIHINAIERKVPPGCTVATLLELLQLSPKSLAVELNEQVVPLSEHGSTILQTGDRIEIVTFVGGG